MLGKKQKFWISTLYEAIRVSYTIIIFINIISIITITTSTIAVLLLGTKNIYRKYLPNSKSNYSGYPMDFRICIHNMSQIINQHTEICNCIIAFSNKTSCEVTKNVGLLLDPKELLYRNEEKLNWDWV